MSDTPDLDLLAAEYVLGTLEGDDAREAARLLADDPAFAASVRAWEARLTPLAATVPPVAPPATLWDRIEAASTAGAGSPGGAAGGPGTVLPFPSRGRLRLWQASTAASLALAASLAVIILLPPAAPPQVAVLAPLTSPVPVLLATLDRHGVLQVRPNGTVAVPADRDLELWALGAGETRPASLGVLPAAGRQFVASVPAGTQLLVSLEPRGGSQTGQPTGPVLYVGTMTSVN